MSANVNSNLEQYIYQMASYLLTLTVLICPAVFSKPCKMTTRARYSMVLCQRVIIITVRYINLCGWYIVQWRVYRWHRRPVPPPPPLLAGK